MQDTEGMTGLVNILEGDCLDVLPTLPAATVQCCVTSPPYWGLRDYGNDSQLGLEPTPAEYIANMVRVFREVWRVLKDDGTLWLNVGDSYGSVGGDPYTGFNKRYFGSGNSGKQSETSKSFANSDKQTGLRPKNLVGIPWRLAFALQADGWYLRSDIIWAKPNPMPESVTDRPTKSHEYIFLLTKQERYFYDADAIREPNVGNFNNFPSHATIGNGTGRSRYDDTGKGSCPPGHVGVNLAGRNRRTVWTVATQPYSDAHFATFPEDLIKPCIMAGSRVGDTVLDPFAGSGTVGEVCTGLGRNSVLIELNPEYIEMIKIRTNVTIGML